MADLTRRALLLVTSAAVVIMATARNRSLAAGRRTAELIRQLENTPRYIRGVCPYCGSATAEEAGSRCKTYSDETGERYCRGGAAEEDDPEGFLLFLNPAHLELEDEYFGLIADGVGMPPEGPLV